MIRVILTTRNASVKNPPAPLNDEMVTMLSVLAIDAGGTSTRAVIVDERRALPRIGHSGGGNPISAGFEPALDSLAAATRMALESSHGIEVISSAMIAMAGATSQDAARGVDTTFTELGLRGELALESDLLAMFRSGTLSASGYALIAGTGSVAARVEAGTLGTVLAAPAGSWATAAPGSGSATGWHAPSWRFWMAAGRKPRSLQRCCPRWASPRPGSAPTVGHACSWTSSTRCTRCRRSALPVRAVGLPVAADPVALEILRAAAAELVDTLAAIRPEHADGPVVLGGSIRPDAWRESGGAGTVERSDGSRTDRGTRRHRRCRRARALTRAGVSRYPMQDRSAAGVAACRQTPTTGSNRDQIVRS